MTQPAELVPTEAANQIIAQGRALVQAIAAMDTSVPGDPIMSLIGPMAFATL